MTLEELKKLQKDLEKAADTALGLFYLAVKKKTFEQAKRYSRIYETLDNASAEIALNKGYLAEKESK